MGRYGTYNTAEETTKQGYGALAGVRCWACTSASSHSCLSLLRLVHTSSVLPAAQAGAATLLATVKRNALTRAASQTSAQGCVCDNYVYI